MSPCRAEARAEDARSALTRGPSRSYPWWSPSIRPQPTHTCFRRAVFPNASCAVALIDRLTHHVEILLIEGRSYRRREAEITQQQRSRQRRSRTRTPDNRPSADPK